MYRPEILIIFYSVLLDLDPRQLLTKLLAMAQQGPPPTQRFVLDTSFANASSALFSTVAAMAYIPEHYHHTLMRDHVKGMLQMSLIMGMTAVLALDGSKVFRDTSITVLRALYYGADMVLSASLRLYLFFILALNVFPSDDAIVSFQLVSILALLNAFISCIPIIFS